MKRWYLISVFMSDEAKIKSVIESRVQRAGLGDRISRIIIPLITEEIKTESKITTKRRKIYPGQLAVEILGMDSYIRDFLLETPGVLRLSSEGSRPLPLRNRELPSLLTSYKPSVEKPVEISTRVRITSGPFEGVYGEVVERKDSRVWINANLLGSVRKVEVDASLLESY
jgi:transcriptional antiterminator NusG